MTLAKHRTELSKNLFKNILFFYPKNLVEFNLDKLTSENQLEPFTYYLLKEKDETSPIFEDLITVQIMTKPSLLEENIFLLFSKKEELNENQFNFLMAGYYNQVNTLLIVSGFINFFSRLHKTLNTSDIVRNCIERQENHFRNHRKAIEETFNFKKKTPSPVIRDEFFNLVTDFSDMLIQNYTEEGIDILENEIEELKSQSKLDLPPTLSTYIIHEKSDEIANIIVENFTTEKGRKIRYIVEYLIGRGVVKLLYGDQNKIYEAMTNSFKQNIGSKNSIFGFSINKLQDSDYKSLKEKLHYLLKTYI